jgi:hypothetical protein
MFVCRLQRVAPNFFQAPSLIAHDPCSILYTSASNPDAPFPKPLTLARSLTNDSTSCLGNDREVLPLSWQNL